MATLSERLRARCDGCRRRRVPAYVKAQAKAEVVIVNAAECEPLLHKDKELLHHFQEQVLDGLRQPRSARAST